MEKLNQYLNYLPPNGFKTALGVALAVLVAYVYYSGAIDQQTFEIGMTVAGGISGVGAFHKIIKALSTPQ